MKQKEKQQKMQSRKIINKTDATKITKTIVEQQLSFDLRNVRGKQKAPKKQQLTVRLNQQVIDYFKAEGRGWQTRLNEVLEIYVAKELRKQKRQMNKNK